MELAADHRAGAYAKWSMDSLAHSHGRIDTEWMKARVRVCRSALRPTTLLDLVEEAFDEIAYSNEVWTEADRLVAITFRRVGVIATISEQH